MKERPTLEGAAGLWQTPAAQQFEATDLDRLLARQAETKAKGINGNGFGMTLANEVQIWSRDQWMTPNVPNGGRVPKNLTTIGRTAKRPNGEKAQVDLAQQVEHWSTPKASDGEKGGPNMRGSKGDMPLPSQVAHWPTPTTGDDRGPSPSIKEARERHAKNGVNKQVGLRDVAPRWTCPPSLPDRQTPDGQPSSETRRRLNPLFVEWLMGWPDGLSGFDTAAMASCRSPQPLPGCGCMDCWLTTQRRALAALLAIPDAPGQQMALL